MKDGASNIVDEIRKAIAGDFHAVTIDGQRWVKDDVAHNAAIEAAARTDGFRQGLIASGEVSPDGSYVQIPMERLLDIHRAAIRALVMQ